MPACMLLAASGEHSVGGNYCVSMRGDNEAVDNLRRRCQGSKGSRWVAGVRLIRVIELAGG